MPYLKISLPKIFFLLLGTLLFEGKCFAATTFDWYGGTSTAWTTPGNWKVGGTTQTTNYPGKTATTDIVQIGVVTYSVTNQPLVTTTLPNNIASITFGINGGAVTTLTVNTVTLTVTGNMLFNHGAGSNNTNTTYQSNLVGTGTIICGTDLQIGNNTGPATKANNTTAVSSQINQLTINGNMIFNAVGNNSGSATNYPTFNLDNNKVTLNGQFVGKSVNGPTYGSDIYALGRFNAGTTTNGSTIELTNNQAIANGFTGFIVDFIYTAGNNGTVIYDSPSGNQMVYTSADAMVGANPQVYYDLVFAGGSTKVVNGPTLTIGDNWTSGTGDVNLLTNNTAVQVGNNWTNSSTVNHGSGNVDVSNNWTNSGTINQGSGNFDINGYVLNSGILNLGTGSLTMAGNYTNNGTYTQSTGNTVFNGSLAQTLKDGGNGTIFNNVIFNGAGNTCTINAGNFSVSGIGTLTMLNAANLTITAPGTLTLKSDVTGTATVATIAANSVITGTVTAQRYITGGAGRRGYRLLSSPINADGTNYSINYLKNSILVLGTNMSGGFDNTTYAANPTVYLYRENMTPQYTTYLNSCFRGINDITQGNAATPKYKIDIDGNTVSIPYGNGFLCFFRGDRVDGLAAETVISYVPKPATLAATGKLTQGPVNVKLWFTPASTILSNISPSASVKGFNLLGNPYASTINFEKFNRNGTSSSLYGAGFPTSGNTIWFFNPTNKQYIAYKQKTTAITTADTTTNINPGTSSDGNASNMIASGQGFFIRANATTNTFSFREGAKSTTQPITASAIATFMGRPKEFVEQPQPLLRLRLVLDSVNTDEVVLQFNNQDSSKYSYTKDAEDLGGNGALESLSLLSSDSVKLCIHGRALPGLKQEIVPLLTDATASGNLQLKKIQLNNMPALYDVWLKDAFTKDSLDLKKNDTYNFRIDKTNPATFGTDRFSLVIRQNPANAYQLLDFIAAKVPNTTQVQVVWKAQNEQNYTNFTVQRSTDGGKTFMVIGGMAGTDAGTYSLLDKNPVIGMNLYRLKQVDMNNTITYSKIVPIQYSGLSNALAKNAINIYPNPAMSTINLSIENALATTGSYNIQITNSSGLIIKQVTSAQAQWQSNVSSLTPGTYMIQVLNGKDQSLVGKAKFVKL